MKIFIALSRFVGGTKNRFIRLSLIKKIVVLLILFLLVWFGRNQILKNKSQSPQFQTAEVERGTLINSVTASGVISGGTGSNVTTSAGGVVRSVFVKDGDYVTKGQKIAEISLDTDSLQRQAAAWAGYLQAKNSLNSAKSKMNALQAALFKANQTFVKGAGTADPVYDDPTYIIQRAEWLQAESDYNNQAGVIAQAQAQASLTSSWYSYRQISSVVTAPIAGIISNLAITEGQGITSGQIASGNTTAGNSSNQTIARVVPQENGIQSTVNLTEIDIPKVRIGQKVTMTLDAYPDKTFAGKVSSINTSGTISSGVTNYPVTVTFDSGIEGIYQNMAISATIINNIVTDTLMVPSAAVQTTDGESKVRLLEKGREVSLPVEIGQANDTQIEIKSGLTEGQTVITSQNSSTSGNNNQSSGNSPFSGGFRGSGGGGIFRR